MYFIPEIVQYYYSTRIRSIHMMLYIFDWSETHSIRVKLWLAWTIYSKLEVKNRKSFNSCDHINLWFVMNLYYHAKIILFTWLHETLILYKAFLFEILALNVMKLFKKFIFFPRTLNLAYNIINLNSCIIFLTIDKN